MPFLFTDDLSAAFASRMAWFVGCLLVAFSGLFMTARLMAQENDRVRFDLPAGPAAASLQKFSEQSGRPVVVPTELVDGVRSNAVAGELTPAEALTALLATTSLVAVEDAPSGAFAIVRKMAQAAARPRLNAQAVIIVGLAAGDEQADRLWAEATATRDALVARGIPLEAIRLVPAKPGAPIRVEMILAALQASKPGVDETWVILLGNIAPGREGQPMFQLNGPRMSADALAAAVAALPGRRYVVVGASRSGGFLPPLLKVASAEAVAATAESGELNEPRFVGMWVEALRASPGAGFRKLASAAAARVATFYRENKLAQTEHSQMIDRARNQIVAVEP